MQSQSAPPKEQKKKPFSLRPWSIRTQLMLFLCIISLALLALIWFLSSSLLQPYYNNMIRGHLETQLDEIVTLMDTTTENGIMISTRVDEVLVVNAAFQTAFYQAIDTDRINLSDLCVNVADASLSYVMYSENLYPCLLHGGTSTLFGETSNEETRDNDITIAIREECFATGESYAILSSGEWQQMLVGKTTADGNYVVFVSATLSHLVDTALVLQSIAPIIGLIVLLFAVTAAWQFSRWFTKPISNLTKASHTMAGGKYDVSLRVARHDELGELTEAFNSMAKEVHRSAELQRELLANVSHDLRTPLTLIRGYAETLHDITGGNKVKREEQLNIIMDETDRLTRLVNSILELTKVRSGVEKPHIVPIEVNAFCEMVAGRYHGLCEQNGWQLILTLSEVPLTIYADPNMLERALDNLLGNAMQHLGADGIFMLRAYQCAKNKCRIEVEDHGVGIPPQDQKRVFDRYFRSRENTSKIGTGLGLSIAQAIFQKHNFDYGLYSNPNVCTAFWFIADVHPCDDTNPPLLESLS